MKKETTWDEEVTSCSLSALNFTLRDGAVLLLNEHTISEKQILDIHAPHHPKRPSCKPHPLQAVQDQFHLSSLSNHSMPPISKTCSGSNPPRYAYSSENLNRSSSSRPSQVKNSHPSPPSPPPLSQHRQPSSRNPSLRIEIEA